ncbi:hypothetical protein PSCICF_23020 [Pseudomonas cichorii]|nr:hypothetical protein PSCICF_23020 [Pseudomonas cichorii]
MVISKWFMTLICVGAAMVGSVTTVVIQNDTDCAVTFEHQRKQHDADAAFEARPNSHGGVKGY